MATLNVQRIFHNPGRICASPTDLSLAYPHGGLAIGAVRDARFPVSRRKGVIRGWEYYQEPVNHIEGAGQFSFFLTLVQWDDDVLNELFTSAVGGTVATERVISEPYSSRGALRAVDGLVILFSPDDPHHPALLMRRAVVTLASDATILFHRQKEQSLDVELMLYRDSSDRLWSDGHLRNLSL